MCLKIMDTKTIKNCHITGEKIMIDRWTCVAKTSKGEKNGTNARRCEESSLESYLPLGLRTVGKDFFHLYTSLRGKD